MINTIRKSISLLTLVYFSLGLPFSILAQLKVTHPINRMVVQRNESNQASVQIAGSYSQALDLVEARVVARAVGQGTDTNWETLQINPSNGQFAGHITVKGGWYKIQVRGSRSGIVVATDSVDKFGVGEVFLIMGHSNAQGSSCIVNGENRCPSIDGAADERVNVIAIDQNSSATKQYQNTADTHYLPGLAFSQLLLRSGSSPFGEIPWLWGHMGDELVKRINVPVLLYNAGFGGTMIRDNYWSAYDIPFYHSFIRYDIRMPYVNIRNVMNLYIPTTGIRAVLMQHGENDRANPQDSTYKYYYKVIDKMRSEFNMPNLGCIVALSSFVGARFENVRAAQLQVINRPNYNVFMGPDLDNINTQDDRPDGIHYSPSGQVKAGDAWAAAINNVYASISPYPTLEQPMASLSCADENQLNVVLPGGYQYEWSTGSTTQSLKVGTGTYSARLKDAKARTFFLPAVVVPATVQPPLPTVTTNTNSWNICRTSGLRLTSSYLGDNSWSTGATSSSIVVTQPGVYSLQAKNPVYGCLSDAVSQTIGTASVDVDLLMQTSRRVVAVNDTLSFRLSLRNNSDCDAGPITVTSRLPPNVQLVTTGALSAPASNTISATVPALMAHANFNRQYTVRLTAEGRYMAAAEVTATTNTIAGATPNNGTANGENDEAFVELRTLTNSSTLYASPNPNQKPLPSVQLNQPASNISKADLSIRMMANRLVAQVGQPVQLTLVVQNEGGMDASNVVVSNKLAANMQFVSSASGMTVSDGMVNGRITQIAVGQSVMLTFTVKMMSKGVYLNPAQIISADQADSDSIPGNGYTNGEDDQASILLRSSNE